MSKKNKYYNIQGLLETQADYMMLLGERSNGKSYQVKYTCLWEAYNEADYLAYIKDNKIEHKRRYEFAYLRRFGDDIKQTPIRDYFDDMRDAIYTITNGEYECVDAYQGYIYFAKYNDDGKIERGKVIGRPFSLNAAQHYKSRMFPEIGNIVMEEVIPDDGVYLPTEIKNLFSIVSTIARRDKVRVFLIGNTMNRVCPYFTEWSLTHVLRQKQGTIDIYNQPTDDEDDDGKPIVIKIAVEMCESTGQQNRMFFGQKAKAIVTGVWDSDIHPHLKDDYNEYIKYYELLLIHNDFAFMIQLLRSKEDEILLFVYPYTGDRKKVQRRITDEYDLSPLITVKLEKVTKYDEIVKSLIDNKKVAFSDNLTGTDFYNVLKERGGL